VKLLYATSLPGNGGVTLRWERWQLADLFDLVFSANPNFLKILN